MKRDVVVLLSDILKSLDNIELYTKEIGKEQFFKDEKTQDAVIRRLEIIGEAVKNIPPPFKLKHSQIEWKKIAGMRDLLIHAYFGVNIDRVWFILREELSRLKKEITILLEKEQSKDQSNQ